MPTSEKIAAVLAYIYWGTGIFLLVDFLRLVYREHRGYSDPSDFEIFLFLAVLVLCICACAGYLIFSERGKNRTMRFAALFFLIPSLFYLLIVLTYD